MAEVCSMKNNRTKKLMITAQVALPIFYTKNPNSGFIITDKGDYPK
jgi:hypothetical protein